MQQDRRGCNLTYNTSMTGVTTAAGRVLKGVTDTPAPTTEIARRLGKGTWMVRNHLIYLQSLGLIDSTKGGWHRVRVLNGHPVRILCQGGVPCDFVLSNKTELAGVTSSESPS